jgi:outer membrane murein-binding lipoprotein Lpp
MGWQIQGMQQQSRRLPRLSHRNCRLASGKVCNVTVSTFLTPQWSKTRKLFWGCRNRCVRRSVRVFFSRSVVATSLSGCVTCSKAKCEEIGSEMKKLRVKYESKAKELNTIKEVGMQSNASVYLML